MSLLLTGVGINDGGSGSFTISYRQGGLANPNASGWLDATSLISVGTPVSEPFAVYAAASNALSGFTIMYRSGIDLSDVIVDIEAQVGYFQGCVPLLYYWNGSSWVDPGAFSAPPPVTAGYTEEVIAFSGGSPVGTVDGIMAIFITSATGLPLRFASITAVLV